MNRRILLIDADPDFHANLAQQLGRYRFDVVVRPDADEAIAEAASSPPALILLAAETDKVGFKTFGRLKKGPLAKTSIILATRSLAPEDIAKHRAMRVHADDYLDKRTMAGDELLQKIDQLIGLGQPGEHDDLDVPVEVDDIALHDGDVVLEETIGDDDDDLGQRTIASAADPRLDQIVAAETDAAFDALLGSGDEANTTASPALVERDAPEVDREASRIGPPIVVEPEDEAVPAAIPDDGARAADGFDSFSGESSRPPVGVVSNELMAVREQAARAERSAPHSSVVVDDGVAEPGGPRQPRLESSPAIMLDSDDLIADEDVEIDDDSGGVPEPVPHPASQRDVEEAAPPQASVVAAPVVAEAPRRLPSIVDLGLDAIAADAETEQSGVYDRRSLRKIHELERQVTQLKTELDRQRASSDAPVRSSREREFVHLRQQLTAKDEDAKRARADLDARTRELAEVEERLNHQQQIRMALEAKAVELEQRIAADGARASSLEERERTLVSQLAGVQQHAEQTTLALASSESARNQLERDLATERATRAASASDAERTLRLEREQMIARHQGELGALRLENVNAIALALEKDRQEQAATHAAAIEAVRQEQEAALEVTRQQLEAVRQQHADEIQRVRQEHSGALDELRQQHGDAGQAARQEHEAELEKLRQQHELALEAQRQEQAGQLAAAVEATRRAAGESEKAVSKIEAAHTENLARLRDKHASAVARMTEERDAALAKARQAEQVIAAMRTEHAAAEEQYAEALARIQSQHTEQATSVAAAHERVLADVTGELERSRAELGASRAELANAQATHERALAEVTGELERSRAELASVQAANDEARARTAAEHANELAAQANQHAAAMAEREREIAAARQEEASAHTAALAELKVELDRQAELHGIRLDGAKKELDDVLALHEQSKQQLQEDQRRAAQEQAAAHAEELAKLEQERQRALEEIQRTQAEHRTALERAATQHAGELAQQKELADREVAEYRQTLLAAKHTLEEATARAVAEREALKQEHEQAIAELQGRHERALAVANGEHVKLKAVGDAEHNRAMAAKDAEHARVVGDLTGEREELQRGLSAARDTIKRGESELASAVQTIADRNAELRTHAAAIVERDQRLAELRKEIDTLETENTGYQEQVLRAYQKIKADEAKSARAKKAMAIALTALDEEHNRDPKSEPT